MVGLLGGLDEPWVVGAKRRPEGVRWGSVVVTASGKAGRLVPDPAAVEEEVREVNPERVKVVLTPTSSSPALTAVASNGRLTAAGKEVFRNALATEGSVTVRCCGALLTFTFTYPSANPPCVAFDDECEVHDAVTPRTVPPAPSVTQDVALHDPAVLSLGYGVLIEGPHGVGKTALARTLPGAVFVQVPDLFSGDDDTGCSMAALALRRLFEEHNLVVLEGIDRLSSRRSLPEKVAVLELASLPLSRCVATCISASEVDPLLLGPHKLKRVVRIPLPTSEKRAALLRLLFPNLSEDDLLVAARATPGYTPAQLAGLKPADVLHEHRAAEMGDQWIRRPFASMVGVQGHLETLRRLLLAPLAGKGKGWVPRGILLHGPSGCGKTEFARCLTRLLSDPLIAREGLPVFNTISVTSPTVVSKIVGQSEANLSALFARARQAAPCVLFIDEFDALASKREGGTKAIDRTLSTLLTELDGVTSTSETIPSILFIAATSRKEVLDSAVLRSGRLDLHLAFGTIKQPDVVAYLRTHLAPHIGDGDAFERELPGVAHRCSGLAPAFVEGIVEETKMVALRRAVASSSRPLVEVSDLISVVESRVSKKVAGFDFGAPVPPATQAPAEGSSSPFASSSTQDTPITFDFFTGLKQSTKTSPPSST